MIKDHNFVVIQILIVNLCKLLYIISSQMVHQCETSPISCSSAVQILLAQILIALVNFVKKINCFHDQRLCFPSFERFLLLGVNLYAVASFGYMHMLTTVLLFITQDSSEICTLLKLCPSVKKVSQLHQQAPEVCKCGVYVCVYTLSSLCKPIIFIFVRIKLQKKMLWKGLLKMI